MKMKVLLLGAAVSLGITLSMSGTAHAVPFLEVGDAGELIGTSQTAPGGTTSIVGVVESGGADLFQFGWGGGAFTADTTGSDFDTQLFLFDASGLGIIANDDNNPPGALLSQISVADLSAGAYFIGISEYNYDPLSAGGRIFDTSFGTSEPDGQGGDQPLSGWEQFGSPGGGNYTIILSGPTVGVGVPEPTTLLLLGLGLAGLGFARKRLH